MTTTTARPPLLRPRDAVLSGVSVALAGHLRWPLGVVRMFFLILIPFGGAGALLYLWLWAFTPLENTDDAPPLRRMVPVAGVLLGAGALAALVAFSTLAFAGGVAFGGEAVGGAVVTESFALTAVLVGGAGSVAWNLFLDREDRSRGPRYAAGIRLGAVLLLLLVGIIVLLGRPTAVAAVLSVLSIAAAGAILAAPRAVTLWSDLIAERSARVREEQRAEIAAHLHDSVLQTLALIQVRAGASSEVARIARAQERELRDWLFATDAAPAVDLATELRDIAAAVELDYAARIELVAAGGSVVAAPAIVGAAREAMMNAARHAGGDVSVYVEAGAASVDVFVRDRGPGVDLEALPDDRLGIRESIIGRMARAGGSATVRPGAGGGTEVHLHLDLADGEVS